MRRVYIGVCGIGLGHASRCKAIVDRLLADGNYVSLSSYGDSIPYFASLGLPVNRSPEVGYGLGHDGSVSIKATINRNILLPLRVLNQTAIEARMIDEFQPDVVLSDSRASTILAARMLGIPSVLLLNQYNVIVRSSRWWRLAELTESASSVIELIWDSSDKLIISDYPPPYTVSETNLMLRRRAEAKAAFSGPLLERRPSDYPPQEELKERLGFDPSEPLILILSTGPLIERRVFAELMQRSLVGLSGYQVVMTLGRPGGDRWERRGDHLLMDWSRDDYELLAASDVVVTRAGQSTLTKALAYGKPLVVVPIPRHTEQESNADSLVSKGVAVPLREAEVSPRSLRDAVRTALDSIDDSALSAYRALASELRGVGLVVDALMEAAGRGEAA